MGDDGKMDEGMSGERKKEELSETVFILKHKCVNSQVQESTIWGMRGQLLQRGRQETQFRSFGDL